MSIHSFLFRIFLLFSCTMMCVSCAASKKETDRQTQIDTDYQMAIGYYENNQTPQAIRSLALVLANDPNHAEANHLMGFIRLGRGQYEEAVKHFKKALETDDLSIERKEDKICFPWFTDHGIDGEAKAYMQLVSGIAKRAKMLTRVTATESPSDNDKFTMRLFLVSLNFKGPEYAFARKFFLRNLSGNSGWRTEEAKARHDARKIRTEIEAPEVTIGQAAIEGGEADAGISE